MSKRLIKKAKMPPYGGMPEVGGYGCATEYEIGAQRIAEAAHCILGSIAKCVNHGDDPIKNLPYEKGHILEELGIIKNCQQEYGRPLYNERVWRDPENEYSKMTIDSILKVSPKLSQTAINMRQQLDSSYPKEIYQVAYKSYSVINQLAKAMEKSIETQGNAFEDTLLKAQISDLDKAVQSLLNLI